MTYIPTALRQLVYARAKGCCEPRRDAWGDHFELQDGVLVGLTPIGRVTITLLKVNRAERIEERQLLVVGKLLHIPD
jgi:hypothetical protein